jgi:signal peptidase I
MSENTGVIGDVEDKPKKSTLREVMESLVIAVILALLIRTFILQPFYIPSGSMEPTLMIQDHIIVNKIGYRFWEPQRGDIVVFRFPRDPSKDFVKRLIGLPGEKVEIRNSQLYINGQLVPEKYLPSDIGDFGSFKPTVIPANSYFMMGDNRNNSDDSRNWGVLPRENVIGKAMLTYWPLTRIHLLTGK